MLLTFIYCLSGQVVKVWFYFKDCLETCKRMILKAKQYSRTKNVFDSIGTVSSGDLPYVGTILYTQKLT